VSGNYGLPVLARVCTIGNRPPHSKRVDFRTKGAVKRLVRLSLDPENAQTPFCKKAMSTKYGDPQAYRYCDHPRPGSIYHLPDIPVLVRGPTVVLLPSGKEIEVPRMARRDIQAKADIHAAVQGQGKLEGLLKMLAGKQGAAAPAGFKVGRAPAFQRVRDHPRQNPQLAAHQGMNLAF